MTGFAERARRGIDRCRADEVDELRVFQSRMYGGDSPQASGARHAWLFEANPCRDPGELGIWICRRDGHIVGQQAEIPFDLCVDGVDHRAAWAVDLMVDEAWRLRGLGPALSACQRDSARLSVAIDIGDSAYRTYQRTGWVDLGVLSTYVHPIRVDRTLQAMGVTRQKRLLARPFVAGGAALAHLLARACRHGTKLVPIERFDERVDQLWADVSPSYDVLARRDLRVLRWRFDDAPQRNRYSRAYVVRRGRVIGYLVLRHGTWRGVPALVVVDYLARPRDVDRILAHAVDLATRDQVLAVVCTTLNHPGRRRLALAGFLTKPRCARILRPRRGGRDRPPQGLRFMVHANDGDSLWPYLSGPSHWLVTGFDSDVDISHHGDVAPA